MDARDETYHRTVDRGLRVALTDTPVVALLGPRQSGKSTLVRTLAPDRPYVTLDVEQTLDAALRDPDGFVAALPDRITLDEIQRAPELLRAIKLDVDRDRRPGRFLLTGSANLLLLPRVGDSLAGRLEVVQLHPLTESEKDRQPGQLLASFLGAHLGPRVRPSVEGPMVLAQRLVQGGYPPVLLRAPDRARQWHRQYLRAIVERDIPDIARVRDAAELGRLLEIVALRTAELVNLTTLGAELGMRRETIDQHLGILERLFLVRKLPAWHRNEASRLIKTPKLHIVDSGLGATLAGLDAEDWNTQRIRFGHLLESFVVQQLIAQAGWTDPDLRFWHYRDKDQVEVDLVITRGRQTWGVEVKAGATPTPSDGRGLLRLAERCGKDFRGGMVLHAGASTLALSDRRILAVPLTALWEM